MHKTLWLTLVSLGLCTASADAQGYNPGGGYNPGSRPVYSPYLNLLRQGSPLGLAGNYFGLVRPELNFRNSIQQLEQQQTLSSNQQTSLETALTTALPPTGHGAGFMTHSKYFLTKGGSAGGRLPGSIGGGAPLGAGGLPGGGVFPGATLPGLPAPPTSGRR